METHIKEIGIKVEKKEQELWLIKMGLNMMETGKMAKEMDMDYFIILMGHCIKDCGKMI